MTTELMIIVRCAKAPAHNYHFIFTTPADEGSTFNQRKSNLQWVEQIDKPVRIDISSNRLTKVDLSPLEYCKSLEYLSLAVNKFETLDLTPLQNCRRLKHLDISHNKLKTIDLTPLAGCKKLTYLYMQNNELSKVNVAPLLQLKDMTTAVIQLTNQKTRPKLVIDSFMSNVPPNLNDILFAFFTRRKTGFVPEWLYDKNTEIEYSPRSYCNSRTPKDEVYSYTTFSSLMRVNDKSYKEGESGLQSSNASLSICIITCCIREFNPKTSTFCS